MYSVKFGWLALALGRSVVETVETRPESNSNHHRALVKSNLCNSFDRNYIGKCTHPVYDQKKKGISLEWGANLACTL